MGTRAALLLKRIGSTWWLVIGFAAMCTAYEYGSALWHGPFPHHLSRQTTCLSLTYNIYIGDGGVWGPVVHNQFADDHTTGRSAGEFPGLYWLIAQIWRITGPSEFVYRLVMLLLHFAGTTALYLGFRKLLGHGGWALLAALLFFASPVMAYFSLAFITEVPALDLVLIACWLFFRRHPLQRKRDIIVSAALFALAALLKVTALMGLLTLIGLLLIEWVLPRSSRSAQPLFAHKWTTLASFTVALVMVWAWYAYSLAHNDLHGAAYSHQAVQPIWTLPPDVVCSSWQFGRDILVYQIFDTPVWVALIGMFFFVVWSWRQASWSLMVATVVLLTGTVCYVLLWWVTLEAHDYYYIGPLVALMSLLALFLHTLRSRFPGVFASPWAIGAFALLVVYSTVYSANNLRMRTRCVGPLRPENYLPLYHEKEVAYWDLSQYWDMKDFFRIEAYNRSIGIGVDELVICPDDLTVGASLYLMRQRGWVKFGQEFETAEEMRGLIARGAAYLFLVKPEWLQAPHMQEFCAHPMGRFGDIHVFDLRPLRKPGFRPPDPWGGGVRTPIWPTNPRNEA